MSAGDLSVYGEWLVQEANGCTCQGSDAHYGHQPGCGYEPLLKVDELTAALKAAGYAVVELPAVLHFLIEDGWIERGNEETVLSRYALAAKENWYPPSADAADVAS